VQHDGIDPRPARHQDAQVRADAFVQRREKDLAGIHAGAPAQGAAGIDQPAEGAAGQAAAEPALQPGQDSGIEPRHADQQADPADLERRDDLRPGHGLGKDQGGTAGEADAHADDDGIDMVQRQRQQRAVVRADQPLLDQRHDIGADLPFRQGKALGIAGGAGGVDQRRRRIGVDRRQVLRPVGQQFLPMPRPLAAAIGRIQEDGGEVDSLLAQPAQGRHMPGHRKNQPGAAVAHQRADLPPGRLVVDADGQQPGGPQGEARHHPFRHVRGEHRHRRPGRQSLGPETRRQPPGAVGQLCRRPAAGLFALDGQNGRDIAAAGKIGDQRLERPGGRGRGHGRTPGSRFPGIWGRGRGEQGPRTLPPSVGGTPTLLRRKTPTRERRHPCRRRSAGRRPSIGARRPPGSGGILAAVGRRDADPP
jgi:hypothetical protein